MEIQIPIGKLKTHCYQIFEKAQKSDDKLIITKRGNPIAEIIPTHAKLPIKSLLGALKGKARINGDLMARLDTEWEAENE